MPIINKNRITTKSVPQTRYNNDDSLSKYYSSKQWRRLREYKIADCPICYDCALNGITKAAVDVHHRIPFGWFDIEADKWTALLDYNNLVCLCRDCHLERHRHLYRPNNFECTDYYKKIHLQQHD